METLPEYFVIKECSANPLWVKYISWLNLTYKTSFYGDSVGEYYGYDGTCDYFTTIEKCKNKPSILCLEQWDVIVNNTKHKILGYKLIKEYPTSPSLGTKVNVDFIVNIDQYIEFWEPIYQQDYEVNDILVIVDILDNENSCNTDFWIKGNLIKIVQKLNLNRFECINLSQNNRTNSWSFDCIEFRKATKKEIEKLKIIKIGNYRVNFINDNCCSIDGVYYLKTELIFLKNIMQKGQIKSLNVGCSGQYTVDLELLENVLNKFDTNFS